jgi:SnoaL-like domain
MSAADHKRVMERLFAEWSRGHVAPFIEAMADDDYVVVEARGENTTPDGRPYHNQHCWVCRFSDGKLQEPRCAAGGRRVRRASVTPRDSPKRDPGVRVPY